MANYICKVDSTYGKKGAVIELNAKPEELRPRQKVMLEEYKAPVVGSTDDWKPVVESLYEQVLGKSLHHKTKPEKALEDIVAALTKEEE